MISCTDFIPAYNELFRFIEEMKDKKAVLGFWNYLSDVFLTNLKNHVADLGIRGCWVYWEKTLNEEAADFTMELDETAGVFSITMNPCPSKKLLLEKEQIKPCPAYCEHCDVLYRRVLEPLGYSYDLDRSQTDRARCRLTVKAR